MKPQLSHGIKFMKVENLYPERSRSVSENYFLNFYFLNVDISLTRSDTNLKLYPCIKNIAVEGTVSQIFYKCSCSFSIKCRKYIHKNKIKSYPFFDIKSKLSPKTKI